MLKIDPHPDYPPEEGRYLRGNDFSPVAVAIILNCDEEKVPPELENLVRAGIESGTALSGTVQTDAPHPFLFNLSMEMIERFRKQLVLIDLQFEGDPNLVRKAVWSCYQESPVDFRTYSLYDPGAYPEPPLSGKLTWRITQPWAEVTDEKEREAKNRALELMDRLREKARKNQNVE
jgi:tetrahydromethanopterin S-methyltransferase subunit A